jgi:hypothetical protein
MSISATYSDKKSKHEVVDSDDSTSDSGDELNKIEGAWQPPPAYTPYPPVDADDNRSSSGSNGPRRVVALPPAATFPLSSPNAGLDASTRILSVRVQQPN